MKFRRRSQNFVVLFHVDLSIISEWKKGFKFSNETIKVTQVCFHVHVVFLQINEVGNDSVETVDVIGVHFLGFVPNLIACLEGEILKQQISIKRILQNTSWRAR